ncbi:MAG: PorV/PorQ family protein [Bacteroidales bacterium]|nr:PorV/PorQ family protein [Bacteroidales bacterium]
MKNITRYLIAIVFTGLITIPSLDLTAGNRDRSGQSGASELLINPWARSSGWGGVNTASVRGLEAMFGNVAGVALTGKTELVFSQTQWLKGSDVTISAFGFTQRVSETGVFGVSITSMSMGKIPITTTELPEGGVGTYSPSLMNVALAYSKAFSNSIYGGLLMRVVNESIADISAGGVSLDAGIQYITGEEENIKFGITLRNIGPRMTFSGDGFATKVTIPGQESSFTLTQRQAEFELPTCLSIGASYDFLFDRSRFTMAGNFQSNAFSNDQFMAGGEFSFRDYVLLRAAYTYEEGISDDIESGLKINASKGLSAGFSVQIPMNKEKGSVISIDYSYRSTEHFDGTHSIGARIAL